MGLIKYGPLAQEVSGTVGGVTFARVHDGKACRGWRAPVNKMRETQLDIRRRLARAATVWFEFLTPDTRDDWDVYAPTCTFTNALGEPYTISGFNHFVRRYAWSLQLTTFPGVAAPVSGGFPLAKTWTLSLTHATGVFALSDVSEPLIFGQNAIFRLYWYQRQSRSFPTRRFIGTKIIIGPEATPITLYTFPAPLPGVLGDYQVYSRLTFNDQIGRMSKPVSHMTPST